MKRFVRTILTAMVALLAGSVAVASPWVPDVLGDGYAMRAVEQGEAYDGPVRCTVIRKGDVDTTDARRVGVLYVHGFNDYFYQAQMGDEFYARGYAFYAVDLRRYGRSWQPDAERRCNARSVTEYYADIDSAIAVMRTAGIDSVVLMGHSTGGLITACYMNDVRPSIVKALILNSPFLDWNVGKKEWLIPIVSALGRWFPNMTIPQGDSEAYSESLLADRHGEWTFNTDWKTRRSPDVTAGWVRAITIAQKSLRDGKADITVPILLMHSDGSVSDSEWTEEVNRADAVLSVDEIVKYGDALGPHVTDLTVPGGIHDLVLSRAPVRAAVYAYMFRWLAANLTPR